MCAVENRRNTFALELGTVWNTTPTMETNSIVYPQSISGLIREIADEYSKGAGQGLIKQSVHGPDLPNSPNFMIWAEENGYIPLLLMAMHYANDTLAGAGDPYTHTMIFQEVSPYFFGIVFEAADRYKALPSAMIDGITETYEGDAGVLTFAITAKGTTISIVTSASLTYATAKTKSQPFLMKNTTLWMNAQSGGALSSTNEIEVTDLVITRPRPPATLHATGNTVISQPIKGDFPEQTVTFKIPLTSAAQKTAAETLYDAYIAETLQKMEITNSGTTANRVRKVYEPQVKLTKVDEPTEDVIACVVEARLEVAAAAPTGMTQTASYMTWKCDTAASPLV